MPSDASERWLAISAQFPIGPKRQGGILRSNGSSDDVEPGQVRQASWLDAGAVVLIASVDDAAAQAHVLPVSLEPGVEDSTSVVIEAEASPLHDALAVWPTKAEWIPFAALDAKIASVPKPVLRALREASSVPPQLGGIRSGRVDPPLGSGAALAIDELFDAIDVLQRAPKLEPAAATSPSTRLQVPLPVIMSALQISQPRAMAILLGKEPLTPEEADQLAAAANVPVVRILAAISPLPGDLERELQEPRWRDGIRRRASDGDEARARTRLGYEVYQLAARESGDGRDRWRQRLEAVLATGTS